MSSNTHIHSYMQTIKAHCEWIHYIYLVLLAVRTHHHTYYIRRKLSINIYLSRARSDISVTVLLNSALISNTPLRARPLTWTSWSEACAHPGIVGFVSRLANINFVPRCLISTSCRSTLSVTQNSRMAMCRDRSEVGRPFFTSAMQLKLS